MPLNATVKLQRLTFSGDMQNKNHIFFSLYYTRSSAPDARQIALDLQNLLQDQGLNTENFMCKPTSAFHAL